MPQDHAGSSNAPAVAAARAYELIRSAARSGTLNAGDEFTVTSLRAATGSTSAVIRTAVDQLVHDGIFGWTQRMLTLRKSVHVAVNSTDLVHHSTVDGASTEESRVSYLNHTVLRSTPIVRARLHTDAEEVLLIEQTMVLDGAPVFVTASYFADGATEILSKYVDIVEKIRPLVDLPTLFEKLFDSELAEIETSIQAVRCEPNTALALGIEAGTPVLLREAVTIDGAGRSRILNYTHYRADRVSMSDLLD